MNPNNEPLIPSIIAERVNAHKGLRKPVVALDSRDGEPALCPFCGGSKVSFVNGYRSLINAELTTDGILWDLDEWQCRGACDGRSFFV